MNPFAPPTDSKPQSADRISADSVGASARWVRLSSWLVPATVGIGLALNVGGLASRLGYLVMRSPVTITATTFIRENFHPRLFEFEQDLLGDLPLVPYFLLYAITLALIIPTKLSLGLTILPAAYAAVFAQQLLFSTGIFESMGLRWYHMIPPAMYGFCYIPITQIGIDVTTRLRLGTLVFLPRLLGLLLVFSIMVLGIAFVPIKALQPLLLLIVLCVLAYTLHKPIDVPIEGAIEGATNNSLT